jgi:hypothetical protein
MISRFLTAEWRSLVMINYEIDPSLLAPLVPTGTELDLWQGKAIVSMVGFLFLGTRLLGISVPFHRNFEEVNLRFYVRRRIGEEWRRGVTFIRELVPRAAIAWMARLIYNEPYVNVPMRHQCRDGEFGILVAFPREVGSPRRGRSRRVHGDASRLRGGIHLRALLGLHPPERRWYDRVSSGTPTLARLETGTHLVRVRCARAVRGVVCQRAGGSSSVRVCG